MLAHHGISFEARDLFRRPLEADEIRALLQLAPLDALFSWRSPTARQRGYAPGSLGEDEAIRLMAEEPRLIRRPLVLAGDRLLVALDADAIATLRLTSSERGA